MRKSIYVIFCILCCSLYGYSQNGTSIINDLNTTKGGQGRIVIYQDEAISNLVGSTIKGSSEANKENIASQLSSVAESPKDSKNFVRAKGYRIQVFSGSDQRRSKNDAYSRKSSVQSVYPNMDVAVSYASPVWRVRAGNFKNREEAQQALREMKDKLPFGGEMRVVEDVVRIATN